MALFLTNQLGDVDPLLIKIIHLERQTFPLFFLLLTYVTLLHPTSLFNHINLSFFLIAFPFHSTETLGFFFLCGFVLGIGTFKSSLKVEALMSSHHQSCRFEGHHSLWLMKSRIMRKVHVVVVLVDYPLAPEHRYPVQYDACFLVLRFFDVEESWSKSLPESDKLSHCFLAWEEKSPCC
ncbi:putative carboxylesterase [Helianthus anomalus]